MRLKSLSWVVAATACTATWAADTVIVGWNSPPGPTAPAPVQQSIGFFAEVITTAARRAGIAIEWRRTNNGTEVNRALDSGEIDLSPAAVPTRERRARYHLTEPWWNEDMTLLVLADGPQTEASLRGKRVALKTPFITEAAEKAFPSATILPAEPDSNTASAATKLCRGLADAALMTHRDAEEILGLYRPPECAALRLSMLPSASTLGVVVMSRRDRASVADRLRREIDSLTQDGTLAEIASRYPAVPASSAVAMAQRMREASRMRLLWTVIVTLSFMMAVAAFLLWRLYGLHVRLKADIEARVAAERALRLSNQDLEAYAYTVSHDLQEPLRMVTAYVDLLVHRHGNLFSGEAAGFLGTIRNGALRMSSMLRDLLEFSRAGEVTEPAQEVDSAACVRTALDALHQRIADSQARIETGPLPKIVAWEVPLAEVFQNLIENSIKYRRPDAQPLIRIAGEGGGSEWKFSVSDNGIGMNPEYADKIFRVFQRLHKREEYEGNGVGLSIAKRIVEKHGGRIWLDWSEKGKGSRFCFALPVKPAPVSAAPKRTVGIGASIALPTSSGASPVQPRQTAG